MSTSIIHVIDDDEDMRTGVARLLRAEGYEVRTYASAGEFLVAPPEQTPGCVVLDLQMPGPSGLELQHRCPSCSSRVAATSRPAFAR
jgi:FixJ family two-component response regulator